MKYLLSIVFLLSMFCARAQKIFISENKITADVTVFVVNRESRADLLVYVTDRSYTSGLDNNEGIWYFVERRYQADKTIAYGSEYNSDLKIMFTDKKYRAGWRNEEKRHLLE